jgi:hypothetical protein
MPRILLSQQKIPAENTAVNSLLQSIPIQQKIPAEINGGKYCRKYRRKFTAENTAENTGGKYCRKYRRKILHLIHFYPVTI